MTSANPYWYSAWIVWLEPRLTIIAEAAGSQPSICFNCDDFIRLQHTACASNVMKFWVERRAFPCKLNCRKKSISLQAELYGSSFR